MRTVFVHIGKPRTATTSFQSGVCKAEQTLRSRGLCVPRTGRLTNRHMQLAWASTLETLARYDPWHKKTYDGRSVEDHVDMVFEEAAECDNILLSNEWFSIFPDKDFRRMVNALFRRANVVAIITLRDQADAFYSAYMQQLQSRAFVAGIDHFTLSQAEYGKLDAPLDHHTLVANWSKMCTVRLFRFDHGICERIMHDIGFPGAVEFVRENGSVPFELSGFVRREAAKSYTPSDWNAHIDRIRNHPQDYRDHAEPQLLEVAAETRARIRAQFAESNARLAADFGHLFVDTPT